MAHVTSYGGIGPSGEDLSVRHTSRHTAAHVQQCNVVCSGQAGR